MYNSPLVGAKTPAEDLHQRRFAGAVVADEPDDLVVADFEVDALQRTHRTEVLLDVDHAQRVLFDRLLNRVIFCGRLRLLVDTLLADDALRHFLFIRHFSDQVKQAHPT